MYKNRFHMNEWPRLAAISITTSFAFFTGTPAEANLVNNPSFEQGTFVDRGDGFQILSAGSTAITGWTVTTDFLAWGKFPNSAPNTDPVIPHDGSFFLDLQGDGVQNAPFGGMTQTIPTILGQQYHFSLNLGTQESPTSPFTHGPVSVLATVGSTASVFTFAPSGTGTQWGEFGFDFIATGVSTPISIVGTATAGGAYIGLDLVSVTAVVVPEPTTVLFGIALSLVTILPRRKSWLRSSGHS